MQDMMRSQFVTRNVEAELCLEFANTVDWRTSDHPEDTLPSYESLVTWSHKKSFLDDNEESHLNALVGAGSAAGNEVMKDARTLRESIYRIFSARAHHRQADQKDLETLNVMLSKGLEKMIVVPSSEGFRWSWRGKIPPDVMLYPLAQSAAELLTSSDLSRVKECANEEQGCGSLFLDSSTQQTRKWCSMESCGTKVKLRKYYARHKNEDRP